MHGQQPEISASVGARRQQPARPGPRTNSVSHQEFWNLSRSKSTTRICSCGFSFAEHAAHGVDHHAAFVLFLQRNTVPCLHLSRCTTRLSLQFRVTSAKTWRSLLSCASMKVASGGIEIKADSDCADDDDVYCASGGRDGLLRRRRLSTQPCLFDGGDGRKSALGARWSRAGCAQAAASACFSCRKSLSLGMTAGQGRCGVGARGRQSFGRVAGGASSAVAPGLRPLPGIFRG